MKTITLSGRSRDKLLHIEAPGCIVNIQAGLHDAAGREVTHVEISASGDRYAGDPQWWIEGESGYRGIGARIIQTNTPTQSNLDKSATRTALQHLIDAAEPISSRQHAGNPVDADHWSALYAAINTAKAAL